MGILLEGNSKDSTGSVSKAVFGWLVGWLINWLVSFIGLFCSVLLPQISKPLQSE